MHELFEYQQTALDHLQEDGNKALWLQPGLGKTRIVLEYLRDKPGTHLIISTKQIINSVWGDEVTKWDIGQPYTVVSDKAKGAENMANYINSHNGILAITCEMSQKILPLLCPLSTIILDESSKWKNATAKRSRALRKYLSRNRTKLIQLTGTPTPNGFLDLYGQVSLLDKTILGKSKTAYLNEFFQVTARVNNIPIKWKLLEGAYDKINTLLSGLVISLDNEPSIPKIKYIKHNITGNDNFYKDYNQLKQHRIASINEQLADSNNPPMLIAQLAVVLANKLLQLTSGQVYAEQDDTKGNTNTVTVKHNTLKDERLLLLLDEITSNGGNCIIFYQYKSELANLQRLAKDKDWQLISKVDDISGEGSQVLALHPASASHGLNLQHFANNIIWLTLTYNLEHFQQGNKRIHRTGQTKPCIIHMLAVRNTIDEDLIPVLQGKGSLQQMILEGVRV